MAIVTPDFARPFRDFKDFQDTDLFLGDARQAIGVGTNVVERVAGMPTGR